MDNPDRLQRRAYMVATLLRQMTLAPEFFEQVLKLGTWNPGWAPDVVGAGGLPAPIALNPHTELFAAIQRIGIMLNRNPMAIQLLRNLGVHLFGLVMDFQPDLLQRDTVRIVNTIPTAPGVPQASLDAIDVIGKLLLDARSMLMHRKVFPVNICGHRAPVAIQHSSEGPFRSIEPAAIVPPQLTPFNMAMADFFGATNVNQQSWTDRDFEPIRKILMEQVLGENANLQDLEANVAQFAGPPVGTEGPEAARATPVGRRRAQSAPPGLLDESAAVPVVEPPVDARKPFLTSSVDAGSSERSVREDTSLTEPGQGTSSEDQGSSEGSRTFTPVSQQGVSNAAKLAEMAKSMNRPASSESLVYQNNSGLNTDNREKNGTVLRAGVMESVIHGEPMEIDQDDQNAGNGSTVQVADRSVLDGPTSDASSTPKSSMSHKNVESTVIDRIDNGSSVHNMTEDKVPKMSGGESDKINPKGDTEKSGKTDTIDNEESPTGIEQGADSGEPMEIDQDDHNKVSGSTVQVADESALKGPTSDAAEIPNSSSIPKGSVSQKNVESAMDTRKEEKSSLQKTAGNGVSISSPASRASINPEESRKGSGKTAPIDDKGSPTGILPAANDEKPMEIDQEDRGSTLNNPTSDAVVVPASADSLGGPVSQKDDGSKCREITDGGKPNGEKSATVDKASEEINPEESKEGSETAPIDDKGPSTGIVPVDDQGMPMEVDQDDRNEINGSRALVADGSVLDGPTSDAVGIPDRSAYPGGPGSQNDVGLAMDTCKEAGSSLQKMTENRVSVSPPESRETKKIDANGDTVGSERTGPLEDKLSPTGIEPVVHLPMQIDQDDQNRANASTPTIAVTDTVLPNVADAADASSGSSRQGPSNTMNLQNVIPPVSGSPAPLFPSSGLPGPGSPIPSLPAHGLPAQTFPTPRSMTRAGQTPTSIMTRTRSSIADRGRESSGHASSTQPDGGLTRSGSRFRISLSTSVGSTDVSTSQVSSRRKQCKPRRRSLILSSSGQAEQTDSASGSSRAAQKTRSRSPLDRSARQPPTYQKITKDRVARFQIKKRIFVATRGTTLSLGTELHDRKVAEAEVHCAESEVYNHPKLQQIMPHLHTILYDLNITGPLPQVKVVKEIKADELFHEWNLEVNGETSKAEWKHLIKTNDPAYLEWWELAAKVDEEQVKQMEMGWITGTAEELGIGNEVGVAGTSGRDYPIREYSPEF